jgi:hypothetical protein
MEERATDEVRSGIESATQEEPFLLSKAELIAHLQEHDRTGCGGYSTVEIYEGKRVVGWDYACRD